MISIAQYGLMIILAAFLTLHLCILLKIIPYNLVWGGRLKSDTEMIRFEIVSILVNLFFFLVVVVQSTSWVMNFPKQLMTILFWIMAALFLFNTLGNALSKNKIELRLFTPITILLTIFSAILAWLN